MTTHDAGVPPLPEDLTLPPLPQQLPFPLPASRSVDNIVGWLGSGGSKKTRSLNVQHVREEDTLVSSTDDQVSSDGDDEEGRDAPRATWEHGKTLKSDVPMPELRKAFTLPRARAAHALSMSINCLKRLCRKRGIDRWPYRKLVSLDNLAAALRAKPVRPPEQQQALLAAVEREREAVLADPNHEVDARVMHRRTATYKQRYVVRKRDAGRRTVGDAPAGGDHAAASCMADIKDEQLQLSPAAQGKGRVPRSKSSRSEGVRSPGSSSMLGAGLIKQEPDTEHGLLPYGGDAAARGSQLEESKAWGDLALGFASSGGAKGGQRRAQAKAVPTSPTGRGSARRVAMDTTSEPGLRTDAHHDVQAATQHRARRRRAALITLLASGKQEAEADGAGSPEFETGISGGYSDNAAIAMPMSVSAPNTTGDEEEGKEQLMRSAPQLLASCPAASQPTAHGAVPSSGGGTPSISPGCSPTTTTTNQRSGSVRLVGSADAVLRGAACLGLASNLLAVTEMQLLAAGKPGQVFGATARCASQQPLMLPTLHTRPGDWNIPADLAEEVFLDEDQKASASPGGSASASFPAASLPGSMAAAGAYWGGRLRALRPDTGTTNEQPDPLAAALPGARQKRANSSQASPDFRLAQQLGLGSVEGGSTTGENNTAKLHAFMAAAALGGNQLGSAALPHRPSVTSAQSIGPVCGSGSGRVSGSGSVHNMQPPLPRSSQSAGAHPGSFFSLPDWPEGARPSSAFQLPSPQVPYPQQMVQQQHALAAAAAGFHPAFVMMSDPGLRPPAPPAIQQPRPAPATGTAQQQLLLQMQPQQMGMALGSSGDGGSMGAGQTMQGRLDLDGHQQPPGWPNPPSMGEWLANQDFVAGNSSAWAANTVTQPLSYPATAPTFPDVSYSGAPMDGYLPQSAGFLAQLGTSAPAVTAHVRGVRPMSGPAAFHNGIAGQQQSPTVLWPTSAGGGSLTGPGLMHWPHLGTPVPMQGGQGAGWGRQQQLGPNLMPQSTNTAIKGRLSSGSTWLGSMPGGSNDGGGPKAYGSFMQQQQEQEQQQQQEQQQDMDQMLDYMQELLQADDC
uniref:RWP-RK domain-containing protein n=1 Tax=Chlamydomonas leiostraca TaxID=1034604 RepID=A0A7S0RE48_9CHLO|mmetsp:Transcript_2040/g.5178  ORF Transcript_2040/g.5178 Transcript_2040/m.5178 type:complete len:1072 (+) Transcript_2040:169-3384(+)|eukprot:CAMPEP_0202862300 /NCGR_PEP_ID=MMETSP1391-20130828/3388_1 /ASSEMBLY_ACC=CAM_ASM_000867 /TAXON_ID=1034604 /ORGANISM="Chlamydomonas leiostraca, Strain SAG 11-49" /LENGTH=1071 /DNA_ID=CAMNT_0049541815 /DNA_START=76 /DNA_END=3291 /DNA_ORIENTATION=+